MRLCERCGRELQEDWAVCPYCTVPTKKAASGGFRWWKLAIVLLAVIAVAAAGLAVYVALDDAGVFKAPSSKKPSTGLIAPSFFGDDTYGDLYGDELLEEDPFEDLDDVGDDLYDPLYTEEQEALLQSYVDAGTYIGNAYVNDKLGLQLAFDPSMLTLNKLYVDSFNAEAGMKCLYWGETEDLSAELSMTVDVPYASMEEMAEDWGDAAEEWYDDSAMATDAVYGERRIAGRTFYTCEVTVEGDDYTEYNLYAVTELDSAVLQIEMYTETEEAAKELLRWIVPYGGVSTGEAAAAA